MSNIRTRFALCRWTNCDLWGEVLNTRKKLRPLFFAIYRPYRRRRAIFVLRIDENRPKKKRKILSRFAKVVLERRKLCAFYGLSLTQMRFKSKFYRPSVNGFVKFINSLDIMLHMLFWRTSMFANPTAAKKFVLAGRVQVNKLTTNDIYFVPQPLDFVSFKGLSYRVFFTRIRKNWVRLFDGFLLVNYKLQELMLVSMPPAAGLFRYFSAEHRKLFFTWRVRRK